ncbi:NADH-cytochrome b5 reductase-like isoform 6-T10 [Amazona ochrocephala]
MSMTGWLSNPRNLLHPSAVVAAANPASMMCTRRSLHNGRGPKQSKTKAFSWKRRSRGAVNGLEVQRAYTPISPGNAEGYFEVLIKCYEAGLMSQYIRTWKKGDMVFWRGPFGGFPYRPNKHGELLMLASGTGLAPMLPILQSITDDEEDETFVTLVCCFPTFDKIYLKPLLQDLARYWNIRIFYVLSQETSLEKLPWSYQENTYTGRLNEGLMKTIINSCRRRPFVLICGSSAFNEDMSRYLKAAGIEEDSCFVF